MNQTSENASGNDIKNIDVTESSIYRERIPQKILYPLLVLLMAITAVADFYAPRGISIWFFYLLPLTLSLMAWRPPVPLFVAAGSSAMMFIILVLKNVGFVTEDISEINRSVGLVNIWIIALIGYFFIRNKVEVNREEWLQKGHTGLSIAMAGELRLEELGDKVLGFLTAHTGAVVGALYTQDGKEYHRIASFGLAKNGAPESFATGEGLMGQAIQDNRNFFLNNVPDDYLYYGTTLGTGKPSTLLIALGTADGQPNSIVELGFLDTPHTPLDDLMERVAESIGLAVRAANYRRHLQNLLEETQRQTEELQSQGEELRVANEELEEQSNALLESQSRLEQQQAEMEQTNAQLEEQTQLLESQRDELAQTKSTLQLRARELEQASQYKSDFLANMSHELRTPLNSTLILAKLLADNPDENLSAEQVKYAETIQSSGNDLLNLINDILDLSKIEAGHMHIDSETIKPKKMADSLNRLFKPLADEKNLKLKTILGENCPETIETDPMRLEQVLKNLLSNAIKFTEKGEVSLEITAADNDKVAFIVTDTGIGIPQEKQKLIFDAFQQADGTTSRKYGGTGLGLSISRELARLLGGDVEMENTEGQGSRFTITLPQVYKPDDVKTREEIRPVKQPAAMPTDQTAENAPQPKNETVREFIANIGKTIEDDRDKLSGNKHTMLVVEDDEKFASILYDLAHEADFECIAAGSAEDGWAACLEYKPDAVILDVGLPDHSGLSVLDRIKNDDRTRHIPVHVISAEDYSQTAMSLGAVGYMLKPVKREDLINTLKDMESRFVRQMRQVLVVEDDPVQLESLQKLLQSNDVETKGVRTARECLELLEKETVDCMVLDLSLPDATGYSLLETLSEGENYAFPPVIVYTGRELSQEEEQKLRQYSKSIIIKGAKSPERLLDEVTLFLHKVVSELPAEQKKMLQKARNRDSILEDRHILIVEDDIRNVYSLTSILEPRGARIEIARNGNEALDIIRRNKDNPKDKIDLVLMDVMMPEKDGLTATREIRQEKDLKKLPIIMLTAKAMKDDQQRCLEAGANDYMAKPLDIEKLLSLVRVWMPR